MRFFKGSMGFFHRAEEGQIRFPAGLQFLDDQAAETIQLAFRAGLQELIPQQPLIDPVPSLKLAQGVPESVALQVFLFLRRLHAAGNDPDFIQGTLVQPAFAFGQDSLNIYLFCHPVFPVHELSSRACSIFCLLLFPDYNTNQREGQRLREHHDPQTRSGFRNGTGCFFYNCARNCFYRKENCDSIRRKKASKKHRQRRGSG